MATFVLIHGAWHGGWCWQKLLPYLRTAGHEVYTPTLTGLGERSHLLSSAIDLTCHIQDVVNVLIYQDLENVILVGHSYGGMVITGVGGKCPERLSQLVYLDAFVPKNGQSATDQMSTTSTILARAGEQSAQNNEGLPPPPLEAMGVTDPADVKWMQERMGPHPIKTLTETLHLRNNAAEELARTFISCTVEQTKRMPAIAKVAERVRGETGWRYIELETGHDAMITVPKDLAQILADLV